MVGDRDRIIGRGGGRGTGGQWVRGRGVGTRALTPILVQFRGSNPVVS